VPDNHVAEDEAVGRARFERLHRLGEAVLTDEQPRLHLMEDLQWGDVASVLLAHHLAPRLLSAPVLVIATARTGEPGPLALEAALRDLRAAVEHRELSRLTVDDVARLVRRSGVVDDDRLAEIVVSRTRGNPLFVTELLRTVTLGPSPSLVAATDVPHRVADLVERRLHALPEAVTELLATAAVVGAEAPIELVAAAHGCEVGTVLDLFEQGRSVQIVEMASAANWRFRHEIVRDAVYDALPARRRAELHVRVLDALAGTAAAAATLAAHALAGLPIVDPDRAVALASRAGEVAFRATAYEEAVGWFERALAAAPSTTSARWRAELMLLCGESARHLGDRERAQQAFLTAAESIDEPAMVARAALGYADPGADLGIAFRTDDPVTGRLLERAISLQPGDATDITALLEARLAAELYFSDTPARAGELAGRAIATATETGNPRAKVMAGAVHHDAFVVGRADIATRLSISAQLVVWAEAADNTAAMLTARRARVFDHLAAADLDGMHREILAFRRISDPLGVAAYDWWPRLWSAMSALLEGRHERAEALAREAFEIGSKPFPQLAMLNFSFLLFFLRREQGRGAEFESLTREYAALQADIPALQVGVVFLLAELGQTDEARGRLGNLDDAFMEQLRDRNWPASWFQLARAAFLVGHEPAARRLLALEGTVHEQCVTVSLATVCLGAADLARAWLHHTVGDLASGEDCYNAATELNATIGARSWMAQAQVDHAQLLVDHGDGNHVEAARRLLDQADTTAGELGLTLIVRSVGEVRDRLSDQGRRERPDHAGTFRREGAVWELDYGGRLVRIPHGRGLADLAVLLAAPGRAIAATELASVSPGAMRRQDRGEPAIDERARREIAARLTELQEEIDGASLDHDDERAAGARAEYDMIVDLVSKDLGLRGRPRRVGDETERARKTVSTRIRRTIAAIARAHPDLGRHLDRSVDTGAWCVYRPEQPVTWRL
jgi:tetratricopeptide (TPR) repeat protein